MTETFCIRVEYRYKRKTIPKSRLWNLNSYKTAEQPARQSPGILDVSDAGGDQVGIFSEEAE
jgi:hypothetical protein